MCVSVCVCLCVCEREREEREPDLVVDDEAGGLLLHKVHKILVLVSARHDEGVGHGRQEGQVRRIEQRDTGRVLRGGRGKRVPCCASGSMGALALYASVF